MAALRNYSITFKSLRSGTVYTVNIGGSSLSSVVPLKGAAQPFVTEEDASEDFFTPIRRQTGYIRILDNEEDADGYVIDQQTPADWWKDLIPATATERPVTVTSTNGGTTTVHWQGYLQCQNFSGTLYAGVQEREFPVQCVLSVMEGVNPSTQIAETKNFAWLIQSMITAANGAGKVTEYKFQGSFDARLWLLKKVDWQNFMNTVDGEIVPKYSCLSVLEDVCRFWGWTCRAEGTKLIFSCMDDSTEQDWVSFTEAQMQAMSTNVGTFEIAPSPVVLTGDIFANINNDETVIGGIKRAVVHTEVNAEKTVIKFAPADLEAQMGEPNYWVDGDEDLVGYFRTSPMKTHLNGTTMEAYAEDAYHEGDSGGFERRIIYTSRDSDATTEGDVILMKRADGVISTPVIRINTKQPLAFGGGSIGITGQLFKGAKAYSDADGSATIRARLGIGMTRATAKWYNLHMQDATNPNNKNIVNEWTTNSNNYFYIGVNGGAVQGVKIVRILPLGSAEYYSFPMLPVDEDVYGLLFLDIYGGINMDEPFEIMNFEITFSREVTTLPSTIDEKRSRSRSIELKTSQEYSAENANVVEDKWSTDLIFASDNQLEFGHGLVMEPTGGFMEKARYDQTDTNMQHPEQHLANRVVNFMSTSKRMVKTELRSNAGNVGAVSAQKKVTFFGDSMYPIAIGRDWRDDVTKLTMMEM